jgi:phosphoribosylformylglycinamidine synthase
LTETHADEFSHAVQIGNAIEEKKLLDALLIARDHPDGCLYTAVTDCGAGGLSSAVGEMGAELGAAVDLEKVPLKYAGLRYDEIWISEAQERMVFAVPPERLARFLGVFKAEEVEATVIGAFTDDRVLRVRYTSHQVGELDMTFLHDGLPRSTRTASWNSERRTSSRPAGETDATVAANDKLLQSLADLNVASKEWVIRQYDHEVQGRSVIKPLVGPGFGPSDAAVLRPRYTSYRGIAVGCGLCPDWTEVDPYWMAIRAVDEALRNVICVGGDPERTAILDNFCWPKCDSEASLGALVRSCRGAGDAALALGLPFISGKDSLNNEFSMSADEARRTGLPQRIAIPGTLLISAIAQIEDVRRCVSMDLKEPENCLVFASAPVESVGLDQAKAIHHQAAHWIRSGKVRSAHDVSDGGLAVAVAEMCMASELGAAVSLSSGTCPHSLSQPVATSYILELGRTDAIASGFPIIGRVTEQPRLCVTLDGSGRIDVSVDEMAQAWRSSLAQGGGH